MCFLRVSRKLHSWVRPVPLEKLFVQDARRSRVCVTKMAQGRRPACCCLSEECLLSRGGEKKKKQGAKSHSRIKASLLSARFWLQFLDFLFRQQRAQRVRPGGALLSFFRKYKVGSITERMFAFCQALVVH